MSLETQVREALSAEAGRVVSTETQPYDRVAGAVARSRRTRRATGLAAVAVVAALALGVPVATSQWGGPSSTTLPAGRPSVPDADNPAWRSVGSWPLRGALAGDRALVDALATRFDGRVIFVEDVAATRLALVATTDRLVVATGDAGAAAGTMSTTTSVPLTEVGTEGVLTLAGQGALVVLTTPDLTSAEVSGTPAIAMDGTVSRTWQPIGLTDGVGRSASVPLTVVRVGGTMGSPWYTFGEADRPDESLTCEGPCGPADRAALQERLVDEEVARAMVVDVDRVDTRTSWRGEVPTEVGASVSGDVTQSARPTVQVILSTLPGGQVLRTVSARTYSATQSSSWDVERLRPVPAADAEVRPVVLGTTAKSGGSALTAWVLAPIGTTVRAVSPQPSVWPTSQPASVRDGVAQVEVAVDNAVFEKEYSLEVLGAEGGLVGLFPAAPGSVQLAVP